MIEKLWYGNGKLHWLLLPFSFLYGFIASIRRHLYQSFRSWQAPIPIVVIGNLTVGGNGKTPLVITLIEKLEAKGLKVGVVSRGYGGKSSHYPLILDDSTTSEVAGDEPVLIYQRTKVPFAVAPNRTMAVKALLANFDLDLILTDDGLQHYQLGRDIEIVVIDNSRRFGNGWWLPAGPMRERSDRLKSVDMIILNGKLDAEAESAKKEHCIHCYSDKTYLMQLTPLYAVNLLTKEEKPVSELKEIVAMAGISNPNRFFNMLKQMNADLIKTESFADHQHFTANLLNDIASDQQTLLMTEKDAVKCLTFAKPNWWFLPINALIPDQAIDQLTLLIDKAKHQKSPSKTDL